MRSRYLFLAALALLATLAVARERTFRLITFYDTSQHDEAGTQNFDVVQDDRGIMYVGNLAGVLEYDGVRWRVIKLPHEAPALRLKVIGKSRIAVGSSSELGYLARGPSGTPQYVSLTPKLPLPVDQLEQIVQIDHHDNATIFSFSSGILLRWDGERLTTIESHEPPRTTFAIGNNSVVTSHDLRTIDGDHLAPIAGSEIFAKLRVRNLLARPDGKLLVGISREGLFLFDGHTAQPFAPAASQLRFNGVLYAGTTSGVYRITSDPESKVAQQIGAAQHMTAGWSLVAVDDEILCGTNDAVYVVREGRDPQRIEATDSTTPYV